jgi:hypothetical protein
VPTETVRVIGVNMKLVISTVDPPLTVAEAPEVGAASAAGVEGADELGPLPLELEPQADAARTTISATKTSRGRRGRTPDLRDGIARFISAPFAGGKAGPDCLIMATATNQAGQRRTQWASHTCRGCYARGFHLARQPSGTLAQAGADHRRDRRRRADRLQLAHASSATVSALVRDETASHGLVS